MAATARGTRRRRAVDIALLERACFDTTDGFRDLPKRLRRDVVERLYARHGHAALEQVRR